MKQKKSGMEFPSEGLALFLALVTPSDLQRDFFRAGNARAAEAVLRHEGFTDGTIAKLAQVFALGSLEQKNL